MEELKNHDIVKNGAYTGILYEKKPCLDSTGQPVEGLYNAWIILNNPAQYNSYTTQMVKEVIIAFRQASNDRSVNCVVFTAVGDKAFCTGGNTKEYAEYYAGNPQEYSQYMRLFSDMVSTILFCEKPVICRVNGMRIAGGQEIGMACDFTIAHDFARFGQAGPKHGSAPVGGSTDFLHLYVGIERAMRSLTWCEIWSAYQALNYGLISEVTPTLKLNGEFVPNPMLQTEKWVKNGQVVYGKSKSGEALQQAKDLVKQGELDLSKLDEAVDRLTTRLMYTFPNCTMKTINEARQKKLEWWDKNKESNREWLALNMMTEAKAGFQAFNEGPKGNREVDFVKMRQMLAEGHEWNKEMFRTISPQFEEV